MSTTTPPRHLLIMGRAFRIVGQYSGASAVDDANAHMARDPNAALLAEIGGTAYLADKDDEGIVTHNFRQSPHSLECCCCGGGLVGRQWHNRDTGYGLCLGCIDYCMRGETVETFERNYGLHGVHYDLTPFT